MLREVRNENREFKKNDCKEWSRNFWNGVRYLVAARFHGDAAIIFIGAIAFRSRVRRAFEHVVGKHFPTAMRSNRQPRQREDDRNYLQQSLHGTDSYLKQLVGATGKFLEWQPNLTTQCNPRTCIASPNKGGDDQRCHELQFSVGGRKRITAQSSKVVK